MWKATSSVYGLKMKMLILPSSQISLLCQLKKLNRFVSKRAGHSERCSNVLCSRGEEGIPAREKVKYVLLSVVWEVGWLESA